MESRGTSESAKIISGKTTGDRGLKPANGRLRRFLDATKKDALKGPPPTQTTSMLASLLDDKPRKKGITMATSSRSRMNTQTERYIGRTSQNAKVKNISHSSSSSGWSKVNVKDLSRQKGRPGAAKITSTSARTLDDLLGPTMSSKKGKSQFTARSVSSTRMNKQGGVIEAEKEKGISSRSSMIIAASTSNDITRKESSLDNSRFPRAACASTVKSNLVSSLAFSRKSNSMKRKRGFQFSNVSSSTLSTTIPQVKNDLTSNLNSDVPASSKATKTIAGITALPLEGKRLKAPSILRSMPRMTMEKAGTSSIPVPKPNIIIAQLPPLKVNAPRLNQTLSVKVINNNSIDVAPKRVAPRSLTIPASSSNAKKKAKKANNDNFVRLNLRNSAGACRGARSLSKHNRTKKRRAEWKQRTNQLGVEEANDGMGGGNNNSGNWNNKYGSSTRAKKASRNKRMTTIQAAIDPLDDFLDNRHGTFQTKDAKDASIKKSNASNTLSTSPKHPVCPRHSRPCKLLIVKKNTTGNKGRKFYACSMPQGERCDFFQWEDDTVDATRTALLHSSSNSGFIARQVAAHVDRLKVLTVPELRAEAKRRGLDTKGKKKSVLARLSVWVRDIVSTSVGDGSVDSGTVKSDTPSDSKPIDDISAPDQITLEEGESGEDSSSTTSEEENDVDEDDSSDDELEICGLGNLGGIDRSQEDNINKSESESSLHSTLSNLFGFEDFRVGQEWAIRRCLAKKRSLLVAPTGLGKSLCYALPAIMMDGVCIVVSPLVSLMEDQLRHLPLSIPAATLSGNMTAKKMAVTINDLISNRLKILFMSPERLASAAFRRLLRPKWNVETKKYERQLPEVSLLCVDEAHCLSQWGHNFRSAFLRLPTLLPRLEPQSVLALTATAGPPIAKDICRTLHIPLNEDRAHRHSEESSPISIASEEHGVKVLSCNRDNIDVAVSYVSDEDERLSMLLKLLRPPPKESELELDGLDDYRDKTESNSGVFKDGILSTGSVIIYVWRQKDAEVVTEQIRAFDLEGGVVCYHGGMDANKRSKSQGHFMRGKARICVATVAFGLGINKSDVRGVIHLCLPPSPEHYLQEIGRAGRDGKPAIAMALIMDSEVPHKFSLSYSNQISQSQIYAFLLNMRELTLECLSLDEKEENPNMINHYHVDLALPITPLIQSTDCKEETIQTMLSMLEDTFSSFNKFLDIEGIIPNMAVVTLKKRKIAKLALLEEVAKCIQACGVELDSEKPSNDASSQNSFAERGGTASQKGFAAYSFGIIQFSIVKCARLLGPQAEPRHIYAALRRLQDNGELELSFKPEGRSIHVRLNQDGLAYFKNEDVNSFTQLSTAIHRHFLLQDNGRARKVLAMQRIMMTVSKIRDTDDSKKKTKSKRLESFQAMTKEHFEITNREGGHDEEPQKDDLPMGVLNVDEGDPRTLTSITADITNLLQHPTLTKVNTYFSTSVQFGQAQYLDYTSLLITKVLHGIDSPRTPVLDWYNHPLWGQWRSYNFVSVKNCVERMLEES
mmetsp:Transcript_25716/g.39389  ORF Transcript_25716/g.39389 Transcript_25716/m.39389 type:complete len:1516 (+) Transcript_25716:65-4612(+)